MSKRVGSTGLVLVLIAVLLFATGSSVLAANKVILECPEAIANPAVDTPVGVRVSYTTDVEVSGFSIGFHYDSDLIDVDSISAVGTKVPNPAFFTPALINTVDNTALRGWADYLATTPIPANDSGLLFTIWFTVPAGVADHCVDIDSTFVPPGGEFIFSTASGSVHPEYSDCGTEDLTIGTCSGPSNIPPTAICQDINVSADANCQAAVDPSAVDNGSFDTDGSIVSMVLVPAGPYGLGPNGVQLIVTDDGGDADTCDATITVEDNTPPEITCPGTIVMGNDPDQCGAVATFEATATDNCDADVAITYSQDPGTMFPYGVTHVTATATDDAGNTDQCTFDVTINDTQAPVAICPGNIDVDNDPGECGAIVNFEIDGTDNCEGLTVTADPASGSMFPIGETTVTVTARDVANNVDECTFTVTVNDTEAPVVTCPGDQIFDNDPGECGAAIGEISGISATDNCEGGELLFDPGPGFFDMGTTPVQVIAVDASGNADTCSFNIIINDTENPVAICHADTSVLVAQGETEKVVDFDVDVTDNCPGATVTADPPSGSTFPLGTTTVTVAALDASGNADTCTFDVTLTEELIPDYEVTTDVDTLYADAGTATPLDWTVTVTSINGWSTPIDLSLSTLPTGVTLDFDTNPVTPTGNSDLSGTTDAGTPVGVYPITITGAPVPPEKQAHDHTIYLVVQEVLVPDFEVSVDTDTFYTTEGIATPFDGVVTVASINGWTDPVELSYSTLPAGVAFGFDVNPVTPTGNSDLAGSTDMTTPAGVYPITITGTAAVPGKQGGHEYTVYLNVQPCNEAPVVGLSDDYFEYTIQQGEDAPDPEVYITNEAACGTLNWSANSDVAWAAPLPNSGAVDAGDDPGDLMTIELNTAELGVGDHTAYVEVTDVTKSIAVSVQIDVHVEASADSVWVAENVTGYPGQPVTVPVTFKNNELLAAMSVGLMWDDPVLTLDSISYVGSRADYVSNKMVVIDNGAQTAGTGLFVIPGGEPQIPVGTGQWFNLHFTVDPGATGGTVIDIDSMFVETNPSTGVELVFNDSLGTAIYPQFQAGSVVIDASPQLVAGTVEDEGGTPVPYAGVELYEEFPSMDPPLMITTADGSGNFSFDLAVAASKSGNTSSALDATDFVVRAFKPGYYPGTEGANFPSTDVIVKLPANAGQVTPTLEWVDLYCDEAYFDDMPLPVGTVIEAFDPDGVLCGQFTVPSVGSYGFMPVYTDDPYTTADEGCDTNDVITLKVNGFEVEPYNAPLIWTGNGNRIETCFDGHSIIEVCIDLLQGWNLISWNVNSEFDDVDSIFQSVMPNVDVILGFEAEGLTYDPDLVEFSTLHTTDHLHGFWVRMNAPDELCVKGMFVDPMTPIHLENNWNLVSYLPNDPMITEDALSSIWSHLIVALGFDAAGAGATSYDTDHPELATLTDMYPFFGYWLKVDAGLDLIYPNLPIFFTSEPADATYTKASDTPTVAVSNTWINLYGDGVTVDGETLPAGTLIQAINQDDVLVGECVVSEAGRYGFMPIYGSDPYASGSGSTNQTIRLLVDGVEAQETVTWTANGDRVKLDKFHLTATAAGNGSTLPDQFELGQNYPNPFNPETSIQYTLGHSGQVELSIYNVLGTKIKTLVSDYQAEGTYTVKWYGDTDTGAKVASGVYFYKLTADNFIETKKMMLLK